MSTPRRDIIDVHQHSLATPSGAGGGVLRPHEPAEFQPQVFADTLAEMDRLGITHGVISGPNSITAEWARRAPDRFIPAWMTDPNISDPDLELARFTEAVEQKGFRMLGEMLMFAVGNPISDERFFLLYRVCEERGLPVLMHTGLDGRDFASGQWPKFRVSLTNPLLLEDVVAAFPRLKLVIAHLSYPFTEQATYMLYAHTNVYADLGVVNWILGRKGFHRLLRQVVEVVGPDKILFGSDWMGTPTRMAVALSAVQEADFLSEEDKAKILGGNARKLLGLSAGITLEGGR